ncbi:hypothetical protein [Lyngbya aestuarii]|uniref:hypothetical protein n=1 Tax=Lyngbya aestuarii TaxID=118322 RepID=UPI00403D6275
MVSIFYFPFALTNFPFLPFALRLCFPSGRFANANARGQVLAAKSGLLLYPSLKGMLNRNKASLDREEVSRVRDFLA